MAGLAAARELSHRGRSVIVLDKGRKPGGRMASRRFSEARFDTGAQFFSARDEGFRLLLDGELLPSGVAAEWYRLGEETYYRGAPHMRSLPEHLAESLDVRCGERVTQLAGALGKWAITTEAEGGEAHNYEAEALLLTPPAPQSVALLEPIASELDPEMLEELSGLTYNPTLALLLRLRGTSPILEPGYDRPRNDSIIYWVADNRLKGISPKGSGPAITLHAKPGYSRRSYDMSESEVIPEMIEAFRRCYPEGVGGRRYEIEAHQLRKWRYARPTNPTDERSYLLTRGGAPVAVAGDTFGGPRVEGAYLSGLAAAKLLDQSLRSSKTEG